MYGHSRGRGRCSARIISKSVSACHMLKLTLTASAFTAFASAGPAPPPRHRNGSVTADSRHPAHSPRRGTKRKRSPVAGQWSPPPSEPSSSSEAESSLPSPRLPDLGHLRSHRHGRARTKPFNSAQDGQCAAHLSTKTLIDLLPKRRSLQAHVRDVLSCNGTLGVHGSERPGCTEAILVKAKEFEEIDAFRLNFE